jgi:hypothetical protein
MKQDQAVFTNVQFNHIPSSLKTLDQQDSEASLFKESKFKRRPILPQDSTITVEQIWKADTWGIE